MTAAESTWRRTLGLACLAFVIGFLLFGPGLGQVRFLFSAYHHGGF